MKRLFAALLMLTLSALPTLAQEATLIPPEQENTGPHVMALIDDVKITQQDDQPQLLIFGTLPDGCDRPTLITKERQGAVLFVDVYHDPVPASVVSCPQKLIPVGVIVMAQELLMLDADQTLPTYLAVNDRYFTIHIAAIEPVGTPPAFPPITLTPLIRSEVTVDSLTLETQADGVVYTTIKGILLRGCADTPVTRIIPMPQTGKIAPDYGLDIFQLLDSPDLCPDTYVAVTFELVVKTPLDPQHDGTIKILDKTVETTPPSITPTPGETTIHVPHTITSVDAVILETFPAQIMLTIKGYQPDGCDVPVRIAQARAQNTVTLEIFRELPSDSICTMIAKEFQTSLTLEGGFDPGTYTIDVNGTVITVKI